MSQDEESGVVERMILQRKLTPSVEGPLCHSLVEKNQVLSLLVVLRF